DGKSFNKDYLNLVGSDHSADVDSNGDAIYPSQMKEIFDSLCYFDVSFVKLDGSEIAQADSDDTTGDGAGSIDINGIDKNGNGKDKRPNHVRISFVLHSIDPFISDFEDYDQDDDIDETLVNALLDIVNDESNDNRIDNITSFRQHCSNLSHASILIQHSVKLGL
ncbi:MAG: hypothetical protein HRU15_04145, partial [Planctomycetes bacterium]|nr:hypothetical protein [Planctomycetota bacterium]